MQYTFDYKHTNILKGTLVILMIIHHVLDKNLIFSMVYPQ